MFPIQEKKIEKKLSRGAWLFSWIEKKYVAFFILYLFGTGSGSDSAKCMHLDPEFGSYNIKPYIIEKTCLHYVLYIHCSAVFCAHVAGIYRWSGVRHRTVQRIWCAASYSPEDLVCGIVQYRGSGVRLYHAWRARAPSIILSAHCLTGVNGARMNTSGRDGADTARERS
jgi:hypothetical protein